MYPGIQTSLLQVSEYLTAAQRSGAAHAGLKGETIRLLRALRSAMFPGIFDESIQAGEPDPIAVQRSLLDAFEMLRNILARLITPGAAYEAMALELIQALPSIGRYFFIDHGTGVVIGGNVWLTESVPPGQTVLAPHSRPRSQRL